MLGYTHAFSGALGWLIAAPPVAAAANLPLPPAAIAAGAVATAGAALLPDIDHPSATISRTFGPVSHSVAKFVELASGGHRQATHSFLFAAVSGAAVYGAVTAAGQWAAWIIMFILAAFAIRGTKLVPPRVHGATKTFIVLAEAAAVVWLVNTAGMTDWWWLGAATLLGCLIHLGGDCCTPERCPLLWPKRTRFGFGLISHTGNWAETRVVAPVLVVLTLLFLWLRLLSQIDWAALMPPW